MKKMKVVICKGTYLTDYRVGGLTMLTVIKRGVDSNTWIVLRTLLGLSGFSNWDTYRAGELKRAYLEVL
jgi:hypothetical protein